ncbi:MAG: S-layer homology domain-containing protein [Eubacteriales bacterium]|nr:S-layer homology domain-containing protein [Eubacteriales bacterium]
MKKITACAMCMAAATGMMLGSTAMAADYNGHWAEKQIQEFIDNGYLVGYPDGSFKPSNTITRAEIATVVNQMMGYTEKADISNYTDLNKDSWYYKQIETIVKSKVMVGLNDTQWDPNGDVTREQVCVMVCELNNIAVESTDKNDELRAQLKAKGYTDVDNISSWAVPYVAATVEKGYMVGYADDMTLRTKNPITRAEAVTLLKECVPEQDQSVYVMMNIPYDEFYASDVRNDTKVDVFSSATKSKTRTGTLAGGSYHVNSDGSQIDGISFPVKINKSALADKKQVTDDDSVEITVTNRGQTNTTTYTGVDALFENETYAYYALSETPEYYKEATVNEDGSISFGKIQGTAQKVDGATADLMTSSNYGDYELVIEGFDEIDTSTDKVYGVIISTDENDYGLRHLENIWRVTDLAWCTGFTDAVHNCPTDSEHYKSMMGQTIQKVTYYTSKGIYEIPMEVYVPVKFEGSVAVESAMVADGETTVTLPELPKDYEAEYSVKGLDGAKVENGKLTYSTDAKNGSYTLTVSDKSGKYADLTATFELKVDAPAKAADDNMSVVKSGDTVTDDAFAAYIKAVSSVTINGTKYAASGRGATIVVNEDGSITIPAKAEAQDGKYEVVISATGYTDVTVTVPEEESYVLMNIPYNKFYAADITNDVEVDVFTSATKDKSTGSLAGNTYHAEDGSVVYGVTYPVSAQVSTLKGAEVEDAAALATAGDYAYCKLDSAPANYKSVTASTDDAGTTYTVSEVKGEVQEVSSDKVTVELMTSSNYGDYEMHVSGFYTATERDGSVKEEGILTKDATTYGAYITTEDGNSYGLRALENIWKNGELAWCTGFTDAVHGCPTSSEHYAAMMGHKITSVTFYTSEGVYKVNTGDVYVPIKFEGSVSVEDQDLNDLKYGSVDITVSELPDGFTPEYAIDGQNVTMYAGGLLISSLNMTNKVYTVTVSDTSGKYAPLTTTFEVKTNAPAQAAADGSLAITSTEGATISLADYIKAISSVSVNGTSYAASGRRPTTVVNEDGTITIPEASVAADNQYEIVITATGYYDLTVNFDTSPKPETKDITVSVVNTSEDDEWENYDFKLTLTTLEGVITEVSYDDSTVPAESKPNASSYFNKAMNGSKANPSIGMVSALVGKDASTIDSVDTVSSATITSAAVKEAVKAELSK